MLEDYLHELPEEQLKEKKKVLNFLGKQPFFVVIEDGEIMICRVEDEDIVEIELNESMH